MFTSVPYRVLRRHSLVVRTHAYVLRTHGCVLKKEGGVSSEDAAQPILSTIENKADDAGLR